MLVTMDELAASLFVRWRPLHIGAFTSSDTAAEEGMDLVCLFEYSLFYLCPGQNEMHTAGFGEAM